MKINFKRLALFLAITLGTGGLAALLTMNSMEMYDTVVKPALAPPPILFPIVWTILYTLMAISAYLVSVSDCETKSDALKTFFFQLGVNFFWPILFFNFQTFLIAFLWLVILWLLILSMILKFRKCSQTAAYLQIPYLLWVTFAGYLNFMIFLLNM